MANAKQLKATGFCLSHLKVDEQKAKKGISFPFMGGVNLIIAKGGSNAYQKHLANAYKENQSVIQSNSEEGEKIALNATREAYAEHILVGWENVLDEKGNEVPYSKEAALEYLHIEEIFEFVESKANANEHWRIKSAKELAEELKN